MGTETDPYIIKTAGQLKHFADMVNEGVTFYGLYVSLGSDIYLNDITNWESWDITPPDNSWAAIGTYDKPFQGIFDGREHTISGIYINTTASGQGLFGCVNNGTIKNVGVVASYIKGATWIGGVVGQNDGKDNPTSIVNCYNAGNITGSAGVGGIIGDNNDTLINCYNIGKISGIYDIGGIAGDNHGKIEYCYNTGNVTGIVSGDDHENYIGGITGTCFDTVANCFNTGDITGIGTGQSAAGGIVGMPYDLFYCKIYNCYNTGRVTGSNYSGSISGIKSSMIEKCYYLNTSVSESDESGKSLTHEMMQQQASFGDWDFVNIWMLDVNSSYLYPKIRKTIVEHEDKSIAEGFDSGSGTENDPYIIKTAAQLKHLAYTVNNGVTYYGLYINLDANIVLNDTANWENWKSTPPAESWTAIGCFGYGSFQGVFNGQEHEISGIYISSDKYAHGLFAEVKYGTVKNVGVVKSYIKTTHYESSAGGVVGSNSGIVSNCYNTGTIEGTIVNSSIGGVVGNNGITGTVENCYNTGTVINTETHGLSVGGVAGSNIGTIINCYNTGMVIDMNDYCQMGGVAGLNGGTVENCYNIGTITGGGSSKGGIIGYTEKHTTNNCYYLNTCISSGNSYGTPLTHEQMQQQKSYIDWDFENIWTLIGGNPDYLYPKLLIKTYSGWENPFLDITEKNGFYNAVKYVFQNALFYGVSDMEFAPDMTMTRAMFVTVLGRHSVIDSDDYKTTSFEDVKTGEWYSPYVQWATQNEIVRGYDNDIFGLNDEITVEQAIVIIYRYSLFLGYDVRSNKTITNYEDVGDVSEWAFDAMDWAVGNNIYIANNGKLLPGVKASRAFVASLFYNYNEEIG